jgi:MFS family permease
MVPKARQGTASAYMGLSSLLGQAVGLYLYGRLLHEPNGLWRMMCLVSAVLFVTMLYTVIRVREQPADQNPAPQSTLLGTIRDSFRVSPREHPDFFWLIGSRFLINMGFYSATEFLAYYVKYSLRAPNPTQAVTTLFLISTIAALVGNFPAGILSDRVSKKAVVYVSLAVTAVAATVFLFAGSLAVAQGAAFIFGAGFGAFIAVDWALATNLLPERDEARFMGVWHVAFTLPQVVAPVIGGAVAYVVNTQVGQGAGYRAVLFLVLVYLVLGALMIRPIRERTA